MDLDDSLDLNPGRLITTWVWFTRLDLNLSHLMSILVDVDLSHLTSISARVDMSQPMSRLNWLNLGLVDLAPPRFGLTRLNLGSCWLASTSDPWWLGMTLWLKLTQLDLHLGSTRLDLRLRLTHIDFWPRSTRLNPKHVITHLDFGQDWHESTFRWYQPEPTLSLDWLCSTFDPSQISSNIWPLPNWKLNHIKNESSRSINIMIWTRFFIEFRKYVPYKIIQTLKV